MSQTEVLQQDRETNEVTPRLSSKQLYGNGDYDKMTRHQTWRHHRCRLVENQSIKYARVKVRKYYFKIFN